MGEDGKERRRLEGYLPKDEFRAWLEMGLARDAFMNKNWVAAEQKYKDVIERYPGSKFAPEAVYYFGVSRYSASHDHTVLGDTAKELAAKHPGTEWQLRSIPWAG
jgi:TolA-binding protein